MQDSRAIVIALKIAKTGKKIPVRLKSVVCKCFVHPEREQSQPIPPCPVSLNQSFKSLTFLILDILRFSRYYMQYEWIITTFHNDSLEFKAEKH